MWTTSRVRLDIVLSSADLSANSTHRVRLLVAVNLLQSLLWTEIVPGLRSEGERE